MFKNEILIPCVFGATLVIIVALIIVANSEAGIEIKLDVINSIAQLVVAAASVLAFSNYYENKQEKLRKEALSLITFFRENILIKQTEITSRIVKVKGKDFKFSRFESFDVSNLEAKYSTESLKQFSEITEIESVMSLMTDLLNAIEQFSLSVNVYGLSNERLLVPVKAAFVELVEINVPTISFHRTVGTGPSLFSELLTLYRKWGPEIDRTTPEQRLANLKKKISSQPGTFT
ncbi:MAG: hypothetical protein RLZZ480_396 [Candidatus Parcubacteria bacterium]|jgi:hypothetical protein